MGLKLVLCFNGFIIYIPYISLVFTIQRFLVYFQGRVTITTGREFIYLFLAAPHVGSLFLTRDQTRAPCIGSMASYPLDH